MPETKKRPWYHPIVIAQYLLDQWFIIGIGVFIVLAWRFPDVAKEHGIIKSEYTIHYGAVALIFLITGLTLSTQALITQAKHIYLHLFTNIFVFLLFPAVMFAIVNLVRVSGNTSIDRYVLAGMMVMALMPTTVASNITMTRNAKGNTATATIEVCIGNTIGIFICPLLLDLFLSGSWAFGAPVADGGVTGSEGLKIIYKDIGMNLGLALFLPLVVGQVIQYFFPKPVKRICDTLRLAKASSFLLLTLIWATFSTQFANDAFSLVSTSSIIFILFVNLFLYLAFTGLCLFLTRLPYVEGRGEGQVGTGGRVPVWRRVVRAARFEKPEATAICFCAAAKGIVVGAPILSILYAGLPSEQRAIISIPLVLYQGEQVVVAQLLVMWFKRWNEKDEKERKEAEAKEMVDSLPRDYEGGVEQRSEKSEAETVK